MNAPARIAQDRSGQTILRLRENQPAGAPALLLEVARAMGVPSFTVEQLAISAWLKHPQSFGLRGYTKHYLDNNKVISMLSGKRGLVQRGYLRRLPNRMLQVVKP